MKEKKQLIRWSVTIAIAAVIVIATTFYEADLYEEKNEFLMHFISDGFFIVAVLYMGIGAMIWIYELGNFYGLQYLGYCLIHIFSARKDRFEERKNFYHYCMEKREKQKEKDRASIKWVLLISGCISLLLAFVFTGLFYRLR